MENNDSAMSGGLGDPINTASVEETSEPEVSTEPLYKGITGHLNSVEDLKSYTQNLEQMFVQQKAQLNQMNLPSAAQQTLQAPAAQAVTSNEPEFEELLYSNPKAAKELLKKEIRAERDNERAAENTKQKFWTDFYSKNDDLKNEKRLVDYYVKGQWDSLKDVPLDQASQIIAKGTREVLADIRKRHGVTEKELPKGGAVNFGASGEPAPRGATEKAPSKQSLTDQLKAMRAAHRR